MKSAFFLWNVCWFFMLIFDSHYVLRLSPEECQDPESFSYWLGDSWFPKNIKVLCWGQKKKKKKASPGIFLSQISVQSPREHYWFFDFNYHHPHRSMGHRPHLDNQSFWPSPPLYGGMNSMWWRTKHYKKSTNMVSIWV